LSRLAGVTQAYVSKWTHRIINWSGRFRDYKLFDDPIRSPGAAWSGVTATAVPKITNHTYI
jgi:hypothetical protein